MASASECVMVSSDGCTCRRAARRGGAAVQPQLRRTADADHLDVLPEHAARVAGAERLHRGFLRREPPRQVRHRVAAPRTIGDLSVGEDPAQEAIAVALERLPDARNVGRVEPEPEDVHV